MGAARDATALCGRGVDECALRAVRPTRASRPRTLSIDACGQIRDALRIWSDQMIGSIRQSRDESIIIYCLVAGADRAVKEAFAVRPPAAGDSEAQAEKP
jgi:hypothetical protein